jgi:DNA-binding NtrC family response regulator
MTKSLLIVEDHETTREALATVFRAEGFQVRTATTEDEACRQLRDPHRPHAVLLDLRVLAKADGPLWDARLHDPDIQAISWFVMSDRNLSSPWLSDKTVAGAFFKPIPIDGVLQMLRSIT